MADVTALPPEVLINIFELAALLCFCRPSRRESPLNVSHTCTAWRELVLSRSRFWSSFKVDDASYDPKLASLWLERSKGTVIDFSLAQPKRMKGLNTFLEDLVFNQARWGELDIALSPHSPPERVPMTIERLPNLVKLHIDHGFPFSIHEQSSGHTKPLLLIPRLLPDARAMAPRLTTLRYHAFVGEHQVEEGFLTMLKHCPNLEELLIQTMKTVPLSAGGDVVMLNRLRTLSIRTWIHFGVFLRHIVAPMLDHFTIDAGEPLPSPITRTDVPHFLRASNLGAPVTHAAFHCNEKMAPEEQIRILQALPGVEFLFTDFFADIDIFRQMTLSYEGDILCPLIRRLEIGVVGSTATDAEAIRNMLCSRFNVCEGLFIGITSRLQSQTEALLRSYNQLKFWEGRDQLLIRQL